MRSQVIAIKKRLSASNSNEREESQRNINQPGSSNQPLSSCPLELNPQIETNDQDKINNEKKITLYHIGGSSDRFIPELEHRLSYSSNMNYEFIVPQLRLYQQSPQTYQLVPSTSINLSTDEIKQIMNPSKTAPIEIFSRSDLSFESAPSPRPGTSSLMQSTGLIGLHHHSTGYNKAANLSISRCNTNTQPTSKSQISQLVHSRDTEVTQECECCVQSDQNVINLSSSSYGNLKSGLIHKTDDLNDSETESDIHATLGQNQVKRLNNITINHHENYNADREKCHVEKTEALSTYTVHTYHFSQIDQELNQTSTRSQNYDTVSQENQRVFVPDSGPSKKMQIPNGTQQKMCCKGHWIERDIPLEFVHRQPNVVNITINGNVINQIEKHSNMSRNITESKRPESKQELLSSSIKVLCNQNEIDVESSLPTVASDLQMSNNDPEISVTSNFKQIENNQRVNCLNVENESTAFDNTKSTDEKAVQTDPVDIEDFGSVSLAYDALLTLYESLKRKCIKYSYMPDMKRLANDLMKYTELVNNFKEYNRKKKLLRILYAEDIFDYKIQSMEENINEDNNKQQIIKNINDIQMNTVESFRIKFLNLCYGLLKCLKKNETDIAMWVESVKNIESGIYQEKRLIELNDENLEYIGDNLSNIFYVKRVIELPALSKHKCDETEIDNDDQPLSMIFKNEVSNNNTELMKANKEATLTVTVVNDNQPKASSTPVAATISNISDDESTSDETSEECVSETDSALFKHKKENVNINKDNSSSATNSSSRSSSSNREDMTLIGRRNTAVPTTLFNDINWNSYTQATRALLEAMFPRIVLATCSLTGKQSPLFKDKPAKAALDANIVNDIIETVAERCNTTKQLVRQTITNKCADEAKLYRARLKRKQARKMLKNNQNNNTL